jgi:hypothetical protein
LQESYNTSYVVNHDTIFNIAKNCAGENNIDGGPDGEMSRPVGDTWWTNHFIVTCASRWCGVQPASNGLAVGYIDPPLPIDPHDSSRLDPNATIAIKCRNNSVTVHGACGPNIAAAPALKAFLKDFDDDADAGSACGNNVGEVAANWNHIGNLSSCATTFCTGLGQGFNWGVLTEVSGPDNGYLMVCARSSADGVSNPFPTPGPTPTPGPPTSCGVDCSTMDTSGYCNTDSAPDNCGGMRCRGTKVCTCIPHCAGVGANTCAGQSTGVSDSCGGFCPGTHNCSCPNNGSTCKGSYAPDADGTAGAPSFCPGSKEPSCVGGVSVCGGTCTPPPPACNNECNFGDPGSCGSRESIYGGFQCDTMQNCDLDLYTCDYGVDGCTHCFYQEHCPACYL